MKAADVIGLSFIALAGWCVVAILVAAAAGRFIRGDRPVGHDDDQQLAALTEPNPVTGRPETLREINRREMRT